jgi:Sec-independent protein translocase protein TatA
VNFLNIGPWELTVILIIAILLLGPQRVLEVVQSIRGFAGKLRGISGEFTSLLQSEIDAAQQESDQAPEATKQETNEDFREIVREGLAPIIEFKTELQSAVQETRQTLADEVMGPVAGVQAEFQEAARETRQAMEDITRSKPKPSADAVRDTVKADAVQDKVKAQDEASG